MTKDELIRAVYSFCAEDPCTAPEIVRATQDGIKYAFEQSRKQACDYEAALVMIATRKNSPSDVLEKLSPWFNNSFFNLGNFYSEEVLNSIIRKRKRK